MYIIWNAWAWSLQISPSPFFPTIQTILPAVTSPWHSKRANERPAHPHHHHLLAMNLMTILPWYTSGPVLAPQHESGRQRWLKLRPSQALHQRDWLVLQLWSTTPISQLPGLKRIMVSVQGAHLQMHALPNPEKERWSVLLSNLYVNFLLKLVCIRRTVLLWLAWLSFLSLVLWRYVLYYPLNNPYTYT